MNNRSILHRHDHERNVSNRNIRNIRGHQVRPAPQRSASGSALRGRSDRAHPVQRSVSTRIVRNLPESRALSNIPPSPNGSIASNSINNRRRLMESPMAMPVECPFERRPVEGTAAVLANINTFMDTMHHVGCGDSVLSGFSPVDSVDLHRGNMRGCDSVVSNVTPAESHDARQRSYTGQASMRGCDSAVSTLSPMDSIDLRQRQIRRQQQMQQRASDADDHDSSDQYSVTSFVTLDSAIDSVRYQMVKAE